MSRELLICVNFFTWFQQPSSRSVSWHNTCSQRHDSYKHSFCQSCYLQVLHLETGEYIHRVERKKYFIVNKACMRRISEYSIMYQMRREKKKKKALTHELSYQCLRPMKNMHTAVLTAQFWYQSQQIFYSFYDQRQF